MPEGKGKHRLESTVIIPKRSVRKRQRDEHGDRHSDDERHPRKYKDPRTSSEHRYKTEGRQEYVKRIPRGRWDDFQRVGDRQYIRDKFLNRSPRGKSGYRNPHGMALETRQPSVMDLDPSDVPRGGKYFLHDNRESGTTSYGYKTTRSRGITRRRTGRKGHRRSQSPLWQHDKFEEIEEQEADKKDAGET